MADPFSLFGGGRSPTPQPSRPLVKPGFFDGLLGRGSYSKEFTSQRGRIIEQARAEKRRLSQNFRRQTREYQLKLRKDNKELYQDFNIKQSIRGSKKGLTDQEQERARQKSWKEIQKQMRLEHRHAERAIERQRDKDIRTMRDNLLESSSSVSEQPPQTFNIADYQRNREAPPQASRRAA